jgi:hypothetical protein
MNFNYVNKKEWIDEYKKISNNFKIEERNLKQTYLNDDYHLNKIYIAMLKDEVEIEKKVFEEFMKQTKSSIDDVFTFFKGKSSNVNKVRNSDIRHKIYKIEESLNKNRLEFKNKFETMMIEEETLEKELKDFESNFSNQLKNNFDDEDENRDINFNSPEEKTNDYVNKNNSTNDKIDEYINYIMNNVNVVFEEYTQEDVIKLIQKLTWKDLDIIKIKINLTDHIIDKNLGGVNLSWQARDHQEFLKLKAAHNNKINTFEFLNELENTLPFIPRSELKNHIKLFNKFYHLFELKKLLIYRYKEIKNEIDEVEKKEILNKITNEKRPSTACNNISNVDKQKLEEWKKKKMQEKKEKFEELMLMEQEKKEKEKEKFNKRAIEKKDLIDEYKRNKSIIINTVNKTNESTNKLQVSKIDMERIKEKNEKLVEKKTLLVKSKSLNMIKKAQNYTVFKLKKMEKLEKLPPKVNEKTENYENKKRKKFDYKTDVRRDVYTMGGNVLGHMTRAVPEWRKSLI